MRLISLIFVLALGLTGPVRASDATIFVAASLVDVMEDLAAGFERATGRTVTIVPGASSTLTRQIAAGAPAHYFISANRRYADEVAEGVGDQPADLFGNRLVIIAEEGNPQDITLAGLEKALGPSRLAVGDPAHVPAGIYARQALESAGIWDRLADRLSPAGDVREAVAYVARGAARYGIVYATDAQFEGVRIAGEIPEDLHEPIRYWGVVLDRNNLSAELFETYMISFEGQNLIDYYGFETVITPDD